MIDYQWVDHPQMYGIDGSWCARLPALSDHRFCLGMFRVE
jgi:hypothetical protein